MLYFKAGIGFFLNERYRSQNRANSATKPIIAQILPFPAHAIKNLSSGASIELQETCEPAGTLIDVLDLASFVKTLAKYEAP